MTIISKDIIQKITGTTGNRPLCVLHFNDETTQLSYFSSDKKSDKVWDLPLGLVTTAHESFAAFPPAESEMDEAIMRVEDQVMPLKKFMAPETLLVSFDPEVYQIAQLAYAKSTNLGYQLPVEHMESLFSRLAAIITGSMPLSGESLPANNQFAMALLILREVMHHLGFHQILYADVKSL